jgi:putative ABC transport system permease protein
MSTGIDPVLLPAPSRLLPSDLLRVGTLGLRSRRVRTTLSCLGIAIGIAALVAVVGISSSSKSNLLAQLDQLGTGLLTVQPGQDVGGTKAILPTTAPGMTRRITGVESVTATGNVDAQVFRTDLIPVTHSGGFSVKAVHSDLLTALTGDLADGVFLNAATVRYPAVVLGAAIAKQLGIGAILPRQKLWIGNHWFALVGILEPLPLAPEIDGAALIGYPIAHELFYLPRLSIGTMYVLAQPALIPQVRGLLPATVDPREPQNVAVSRPSDVLAARGVTDNAFTGLLLGLGAVALIVGGIGIANVMVIAVLERRTEIGLRRALGATRRHIAIQFVAEAFALSALGGLAGILLGALATTAFALSRGWGVSVPIYALAGGFVAAVLTGVSAGTYPALRAARLAPTDALRTV